MSQDSTIAVSTDLWLAPLAESDRAAVTELLNDEQIASRMLKVPHPYGEADFDSFLAIARSATEDAPPVHFTIHHREHGPIGGFGFEGLRIGHRVELGYWLGQSFWGQGIMPRVIRRACEFAFREFQVTRVFAHVFTTNPASTRVLEKCGFVCEGLLRNALLKNGEPIDARMFALLAAELSSDGIVEPEVPAEESRLKIERAITSDVPEVAALFDAYRQFYGQLGDLSAATGFVSERLSRGESTILVARLDGSAVGFTQLYPSFSSVSMRRILVLNDLFVRLESRKLGVGTALIEAAAEFGRDQNCRRLTLCTQITNRIAKSIYESRGWVRDEEFYYYSFEL
jgi:RimJ/RimL family protein N-acetyltransferase